MPSTLGTATTAERGPAPRGALPLLLLASTLSVLAGAVISPVLPMIRADLRLSGTAVGLVLTTHGLVIAVASPLVGRAVDRWGFRGPLAAGLLVYALAGAAGLVVESYRLLIASRVVFGVGAALLFAATTTAMLTLYTGPHRDRAMGWRSSATAAGGIVWPLAGGALGALSWHAPFGVYLIALPFALGALALLPSAAPVPGERERGGLPALLRARPVLLLYYGLQLTMASLLYCIVVFLPLRLADLGVRSPLLLSVFTAVTSAAATAVGFGYARLRATASYTALLRSSVALWAAGFLLLGVAAHPVPLGAGAALFGLGQGVAFPALTVLIGDAAPERLRGRATALTGTTMFLGQFATPLLFGPLADRIGVARGYLIVAGILAALATGLACSRPGPR
ncbi:putative MFS family arabinose efflux permease [Prauserella shujinwangii]|uniref:Putative MFS family arabinose efflux permease n=1 Tax=Prauserella shujinwangii TaxID=1453103 RepID=A0A2T0LPG5_9PSEU|nr:MFS transporter [Prauserella shujinwangii]PRX45142.1 putative MFS family arabinose efflux permease [Prauserella shujinwangii]